jgi:hypothetical protein
LRSEHDAGCPAGERQGRRDGVVDAVVGGRIDAQLTEVTIEPVGIRYPFVLAQSRI